MVSKMTNTAPNSAAKKYAIIGIIAAAVVAVGVAGIFAVSALNHRGGGKNLDTAMTDVTVDAANGSELRIAVIRMDAIQTDATALKDLRKQREAYETKLRDELTREQKALEKEKAEIEKSQDVLSREALQRRVVDYQNRVAKLQQDLSERAQAIEISFQKALNDVQTNHLDAIIEATIAKKKLSLVIDGRFARVGNDAMNLDITDQIIDALNKKLKTIKMEKPKGF